MATLYYEPFKVDENGELPPPDAIENILPDYKYIFYDPNRKAQDKSKAAPHASPQRQEESAKHPANGAAQAEGATDPRDVTQDAESKPQSSKALDSLEAKQLSLIDVQMKDLENYRIAVHKMGKDILLLRDRIRELEEDNSALRRQINGYEIRSKELMMSTADMETIDRSELIVRYMTLKHQLHVQSDQLTEVRDKYQRLQVQHVKQMERDKQYGEMKRAHLAQSHALQKLQEKVKKTVKLEQACFNQEKVIENMEKVLKSKKFNAGDASKALEEENQRLRKELQQLREGETNEEEKLRLYEQLERADGRIASLERTLSEQSRGWAREKNDLQLRLREAEHGFSRPTRSLDLPAERGHRPPEPGRYGSPKLAPILRR